jgi:hypothetical protein
MTFSFRQKFSATWNRILRESHAKYKNSLIWTRAKKWLSTRSRYNSRSQFAKSTFVRMKYKNFCDQSSKWSYRERFSIDTSNRSEMNNTTQRSKTRAIFVICDLRHEIRTIWRFTWKETIANKKSFRRQSASIFVKKLRRSSKHSRIYNDSLNERRIKIINRAKCSKCSLSSLTI